MLAVFYDQKYQKMFISDFPIEWQSLDVIRFVFCNLGLFFRIPKILVDRFVLIWASMFVCVYVGCVFLCVKYILKKDGRGKYEFY